MGKEIAPIGFATATLPTGCSAKVEVTVNYTPIDTSSHVLVGHFTNSSAGISVFPNPSPGNLNIKWTNQAIGTAEIYADSAFYIRSSAIGTLNYKGPGVVKELSSEGIGKVQKVE